MPPVGSSSFVRRPDLSRRVARVDLSVITGNPELSETTLWAGLSSGGDVIGLLAMLVFVVVRTTRLYRERPVG